MYVYVIPFSLHRGLFDMSLGSDGFAPYLLGDSGYSFLPWLVFHRATNHSSLETLYDCKLWRGCVAENAFGILKKTWCNSLRNKA